MTTPSANEGRLVGQTVGHYRIVEKIGAGGMGEVYRAHDEHLDREVAIKLLPPGTLSDESSRKRFRKEALALSKLNHPNIATIYDFDTQQDVDLLVMEYIPGVTLSEKLAKGPLPEKEMVALGTQLAEGLSAAHERGVVHRDLKPGNLRLTADERLKILDFGLARLLAPTTGEAETESMTQAVVGTLPYMSPEQLRGDTVDARSDIWSAGAVLYEMATGNLPFQEKVTTATADAILHNVPVAPRTRRKELSVRLEEVILKCLEKDRENRYQSAKELAVDLRRLSMSSTGVLMPTARRGHKALAGKAAVAVLALGVLLLVGGLFFRSRRAHALTPSDTIVLADFVNTTGDPVFEDALKQALTVQLEQSPFVNILPQTKVQDTLRLMGRSVGERLTPELGRDLCQRAGGKALITGSIAPLGSQYVVGLTATACSNGNHLASEQAQAANKEEVLKVLGKAASSLRSKLGESLSSVKKFDVPIYEATTPSLEALKAYSLGRKAFKDKGNLAAIPLYERAIELDPNFAMAYAGLAVSQGNLNRFKPSRDAAEKAFVLRDRVSEREKFRISAFYYSAVVGDLERTYQAYRQWEETYPTDVIPHADLSGDLPELGRWEEAVAEAREALRLDPSNATAHVNLAQYSLGPNPSDGAETVIREALARGIDPVWLRLPMYQLAFVREDSRKMEQLVGEAAGKGDEQFLLSAHAATEAYYGKLTQARAFSRRAMELERRTGSQQSAALEQAEAALHAAEFGNLLLARHEAMAALATVSASDEHWTVTALVALALARIGDTKQAKAMAQELERNNQSNTRLNAYWLPTIDAVIELEQSNATRAITLLEKAAPYELGAPEPLATAALYPAYVRGQAYLLKHQGAAAASEFQKFLDHRGIVLNYPLGALAHLQLGRAYAMSGNTAKAKAAYQDFLTLWKDADPDIPILKQAKSEYAKLQ